MTPPAAIVLAAGRGARLGRPKALLELDGELLLARHLRRLAELGCTRVVAAVPRALADALARSLGAAVLGLETSSQAASLAACLRALEASTPLPADAPVLVTPVDLLPPRLDTLRALLAALGPGIDAVAPRHAGRLGHPVLARRRLLAAYDLPAAPDGPPPLNALLAARRAPVDVDDPAVLGDFDHADDLPGPSRGA